MVSVEIKYLLFNICVLYIIKKGRKGCDKPSHLRVSVAYLHLMEGDRSSGFSVPYLITLILVITYQVNRVINWHCQMHYTFTCTGCPLSIYPSQITRRRERISIY